MPDPHELHPQAPHGLTASYDPSTLRGAALLDRVTIQSEQNGLYVAEVPTELVYAQDVPVSEDQVEYLRNDLALKASQGRGTGQESPIALAEVPGFHALPIMDGFHRVQAFQRLDTPVIWATIRAGSSWEHVFTERITNARVHLPVQFSRIVEWSVEAWNQTPWAQQKGIAATQAFNLGFSPHMTGTSMHGKNRPDGETLTASEVAAIREWVKQRCTEWKLKPGSIYDYLSTAEKADPELVRQVRLSKGGRGDHRLTPYHLKAIALAFPGRDNYAMQRTVAEVTTYQNLTTPQVRALVVALREASTPQEIARVLGPGLKGIISNRIYSKGEQRKRIQAANSMGWQPSPAASAAQVAGGNLDSVALHQASEKLFATELRAAAHEIGYALLKANNSHSVSLEILRRMSRSARDEALPYLMRLIRGLEADFSVVSAYSPPRRQDEASLRPTAEEVKMALPHMDTLERQAAVFRIFYGLSDIAIARILGVEEAPVRMAVDRMKTLGIS